VNLMNEFYFEFEKCRLIPKLKSGFKLCEKMKKSEKDKNYWVFISGYYKRLQVKYDIKDKDLL